MPSPELFRAQSLGQKPHQIAGDQRHLAQFGGRQIAGQAVKIARPAGPRRKAARPWHARAVIRPGQHVARAAGGHARIAGRVAGLPPAVGDQRAMSFEHHDHAAAAGQFARRPPRVPGARAFGRSAGRTRPGAASASAGRPAAPALGLRGQGVQRVGIDHHRLGNVADRAGRPTASRSGERPKPGPQATTVAASASSRSARRPAAAMRPGASAGSGGGHVRGLEAGHDRGSTSATASRTRPAPPRRAAMPASVTAPVMPREPPTISAVPKVALVGVRPAAAATAAAVLRAESWRLRGSIASNDWDPGCSFSLLAAQRPLSRAAFWRSGRPRSRL